MEDNLQLAAVLKPHLLWTVIQWQIINSARGAAGSLVSKWNILTYILDFSIIGIQHIVQILILNVALWNSYFQPHKVLGLVQTASWNPFFGRSRLFSGSLVSKNEMQFQIKTTFGGGLKFDSNWISTNASRSGHLGHLYRISKHLSLCSEACPDCSREHHNVKSRCRTLSLSLSLFWCNGGVLHHDLTARLFEGQDDWSPFLILPHWKATSPAYWRLRHYHSNPQG